jgi:hypothetical protein
MAGRAAQKRHTRPTAKERFGLGPQPLEPHLDFDFRYCKRAKLGVINTECAGLVNDAATAPANGLP